MTVWSAAEELLAESSTELDEDGAEEAEVEEDSEAEAESDADAEDEAEIDCAEADEDERVDVIAALAPSVAVSGFSSSLPPIQ